ncbi:VOC family protein [Bacillus sp. RAR_GA_16]|uniref:VOC family protein n=1 Tax=Bacillus sp. RAR_GA_16 TaxID=2876774 RepID=UPI001CCCFD21|nr:VOC family protein [Bacillus sp. RAR_GA_16]MCA0170592.1 VOC family protein [Bacillus sp. RAR_GA_16]
MSFFEGVYQVNIRVRNIKDAVKWYEEILGLHVTKDYGDTVVLSVGEGQTAICLIELKEGEEPPSAGESGSYPVLHLAVEHAETFKNELRERGVSVDEEDGIAHFKFYDPDGNALEAYLPGLYEKEEYAHLR